jgi:toxin ParE1/3/4
MRKLRWAERATRDLAAIGDYIALDDPSAARAWVEKLRSRAAQAALVPNAGRMVPEFGRDDLREVRLRTYRIVYRVVKGGGIFVLTVVEGHQLLGGISRR